MDAPAASPGPAGEPRPRATRAAVAVGIALSAAALVVAVVAGVLVARSGPASGPESSIARRLADSARSVAVRHPEMRTELEPLTEAELSSATTHRPTVACGVAIVEPVGASASDRPVVRWRGTRAATYIVEVRSGGASKFRRAASGERLDYPAEIEGLEPGVVHEVIVRPDAAAGPATPDAGCTSTARFEVLAVPHRVRWASITGDVRSNEPEAIRELVLAHGAFRRRLFGEALRHVEAFEAGHPGVGGAARPIRDALERLLGLPARP